MKSFREFLNEEWLFLESLQYHDEHLFKNVIAGKYEPSKNELEKISIVMEDSNHTYLENDEEIPLIETYQKDPNSQEGRDALDKLVENKMGLIYKKVNSFLNLHQNLSQHKDDLVQEGVLGLIKAIDKFDTKSGNIFNAYAIKNIVGSIMNAFNPVRQKSVVPGKTSDNGPTVSMTSIDTPVSQAKGDFADKNTTVGDVIPDEKVSGVEEMEEDEEDSERKALLNDWLKQLPETTAKAIKMYFPDDDKDKKTYQEIGDAIGMSKMGAKKLIDRTLIKLKQKAKEYYNN